MAMMKLRGFLTKLGRKTGKGKRWNEQRVKTIRNRKSIPGQKRTKADPNRLTLQKAAIYCNVSQSTIKKMVSKGVLEKEQIVPWAPWEIKKIRSGFKKHTKHY